ncbi:MAG: magnesium and cobalt transport protein CorA [Nocardiaceae bacterium]|nr:magnesium and cobalt transport protein CorA [Nocardiaceae bacterium]
MGSAVVDCAVYVDGVRLPGAFSADEALAEVRTRGEGFCWLGVHEPSAADMAAIARTFGFHELAVEDAVHAHQRPKLERYDDLIVVVLRTVRYAANDPTTGMSEIVETGEVMVFLGADFVVTVRHGEHGGLRNVRKMLEQNPVRLSLGPGAVLHGVADHVVDAYVDVIEQVEDDVDAMEESVFDARRKTDTTPIYHLKREVVELRRSVNPLAEPLHVLSTSTDLRIPKEVRRYFRDVADHHSEVADRIIDFDDTLSALVSAALGSITLQQNNDMRKISAWVAIIVVPTLIAGIYGMNFEHMPELTWAFGYPMALSLMGGIALWLYITLRRRKWL